MTAKSSAVHFLTGWTQRTLSMTPISWRSAPGPWTSAEKEKDYKRSMGKELEIRTYRAIERNREFYGILTAYDDNSVTILEEDGTERVFRKAILH